LKYALTLSRWLKVAERIDTALKEREANVRTSFTATTISPWNPYGVEEKAADIARRAASDLALVEVGTRAIATIRSALARRNAELGISGRLAEVAAARRRAVLYQAVIEGQKSDMVRPEGLGALPAELLDGAEAWELAQLGTLALTLQTADPIFVESLREGLARERQCATRLLDEIADLNREQVEIDLPQEVLGIAALAA
jgi:hypothetical protein